MAGLCFHMIADECILVAEFLISKNYLIPSLIRVPQLLSTKYIIKADKNGIATALKRKVTKGNIHKYNALGYRIVLEQHKGLEKAFSHKNTRDWQGAVIFHMGYLCKLLSSQLLKHLFW